MANDICDQIRRDAGQIPKTWTPKVHCADIYWCYRLLLQRPPEFSDKHSYAARCSQDLKSFVRSVLQSQEFSQYWAWDLKLQPLPPVTVLAESGGLRFWFNLRDRTIGLAIAQGCYEPDVTRVVRTVVKPGMNCLDLGANLGYFTVLLGSIVGRTGRVYAFEPFPSNCDLLSRNIRENHLEAVVQVHQVAAYDKDRDCTLHFRADDLNDNYGSMFIAEDQSMTAGLASLKCTGRRVEDVLPSDLPIHFVKMDIEGGEVRALRGMTRILERDHPIIVAELNEQGLVNAGYKPEELITTFRSFGYDILDITTQSPLVLRGNRSEYAFTNLLCT